MTAEEILENITCCTIKEDADLDVKSNYYYQHDDVVKAIEQAQKDAYNEAWEHAIALRARIGNPYNERESKDMLDFEIEARKLKK